METNDAEAAAKLERFNSPLETELEDIAAGMQHDVLLMLHIVHDSKSVLRSCEPYLKKMEDEIYKLRIELADLICRNVKLNLARNHEKI